MIITYLGKQFFKIQQGETVLAFNPNNSTSRSSADIVFVTTNHPDYNAIKNFSFGEKKTLIIKGPGDYETKDISIKGIMSHVEISGKKYINTSYIFSLDGIKVVFLGALSDPEITKEIFETIDSTDILFISLASMDLKTSLKTINSLEPKIVIPMDYDPASLKAFLKENGEEKKEAIVKLTLKRKDLEGKDEEIVVLNY
jgi:L-ascorbate metabolism protein UlaG (beta-lactamase superfamily)